MATDPLPRWRRRSEARPQEILAAALEVFGERGFAATRMDDVATTAGISKGTLYLYFPNKEELFKAVVRAYLVAQIDEAETQIAHATAPTIALIDLIIDELARRVLKSPAAVIPKLIIGEARNFPDVARFYVEEVIQRIFRLVRVLVERGIARGEFRPLAPETVAPVLVGPLLLASIWKTALAPVAPDLFDLDHLIEAHHQTMRAILLKPEGDAR